jgi:hypothetical protein
MSVITPTKHISQGNNLLKDLQKQQTCAKGVQIDVKLNFLPAALLESTPTQSTSPKNE